MFTYDEAVHILLALVASRSLANTDEAKQRAKSIAEKLEAEHPNILVQNYASILIRP